MRPTEPTSKNLELPFLPTDRSRIAGNNNLIEAPIWRLDKENARPRNKDGSVNLELYTLRREWMTRGPNGETLTRKVVVTANAHFGYPTMFGNRIMHGLVREADRRQYDSRRIPVKLADICRWLDVKPSKRWYRLIIEQLKALEATTFAFEDAWYIIKDGHREGSYFPGVFNVKLITNFQFAPMVKRNERGRQADLGLGYDDWVELGEEVFESIRTDRIPLDLDYMNHLAGGVTQRLYEYLEKRSYGKPSYHERLKRLAPRLPLSKTTPSGIKGQLEPALKRLCTPDRTGKRLLVRYAFYDPGSIDPQDRLVREHTLWVWFQRVEGSFILADLKAKIRGRAAAPMPVAAADDPDDDA